MADVKRRDYDLFDIAYVKQQLDKLVVGQHRAKRHLLIAAHLNYLQYYYKFVLPPTKEVPNFTKLSVLLVGSTGVGKTFLVKTLADILHVPLLHVDTAFFVPPGWLGSDGVFRGYVTTLMEQCTLLAGSGGFSVEGLLRRSIIFVDELDKLALGGMSEQVDNSFVIAKQQALLRFIEGQDLTRLAFVGIPLAIPSINTEPMLVVAGGTFATHLRVNKSRIGFNTDVKEPTTKLDKAWLERVGLISELCGRIGTIVQLEDMSTELLKKIATTGENCLKTQYEFLLKRKITDKEITELVSKTLDLKLGARGLTSTFLAAFEDEVYDVLLTQSQSMY